MRNPTLIFRLSQHALPRLKKAGRFPLDEKNFSARYRSETHALHLHEYVGRMQWAELNCERKISPGDITLSPAGGETRYHLDNPGHHYCIHFYPYASGDHASVGLDLHIRSASRYAHYVERFRRIADFRRRCDEAPIFETRASLALQDLLLELSQERRASGALGALKSDCAIEQVARIIADRFAEDWTIEQLCEQVDLSRNYLSRRFRLRYGVSIVRYLLMRRVDHAKDLLTLTNLPIGRIAHRVGLSDPQHFNKQFRRLTGTSPSAYRLNQWRKPPGRARGQGVSPSPDDGL